MKHNPGFLKLVEQAKRTIKECRIADVKVKLDRGDPFHFIDVREDNEFAKDHAKGAAHLGRTVGGRSVRRRAARILASNSSMLKGLVT